MRLRKDPVRASAVISPRASRRPASAMPSRVRSVMAGLFVGAEDLRRLGGPGPMGGDALHQLEQADIALVQMLDVLGGERKSGQLGADAELLERWCLRRRHCSLPMPKHMQATCRVAWLGPCISRSR